MAKHIESDEPQYDQMRSELDRLRLVEAAAQKIVRAYDGRAAALQDKMLGLACGHAQELIEGVREARRLLKKGGGGA